jgi:hypothetical protein
MDNYEVKYKVNLSTTTTRIRLQGGTESEAIAKLKSQGTVAKDATIIILSIKKS